jgi:pyridoxine 4-dehydrogenase
VNAELNGPTKLTLGDAEIARIGLGTNRLTNTPANIAFVKEAVAAGIGMIDTAYTYTGGESEETIGAAVFPDPERCVVATKGGGGGPGGGRPEILHVEIEESLRRLRSDSIALYYLHRVDPETPLEESLAAIKQPRQDKTCGRIQRLDRRDRASPRGRADRSGPEPLQPL